MELPIPTCNSMSELVTDYLEGTLPLGTRVAAGLHLFACRACKTYYGQVRETIRLVRSGVPRPPAESVEEAVLTRMTKPHQGDPIDR